MYLESHAQYVLQQMFTCVGTCYLVLAASYCLLSDPI